MGAEFGRIPFAIAGEHPLFRPLDLAHSAAFQTPQLPCAAANNLLPRPNCGERSPPQRPSSMGKGVNWFDFVEPISNSAAPWSQMHNAELAERGSMTLVETIGTSGGGPTADANVVGIADENWSEAVTAVVTGSLRPATHQVLAYFTLTVTAARRC